MTDSSPSLPVAGTTSRSGTTPFLVTLSGIDGSGKSTHGAALIAAFEEIGITPRTVTARIGRLTPLRLLIAEVQRRRRKRSGGEPPRPSPRATADQHWTGWRLTVWSILTALDYVLWLQWVRWLLWRGRVVIADRYLADFAVEFTILVRSQPRLRALLLAPLPWLAPRPQRSYYLRISPETSLLRKPDDQHGYDHHQVVDGYDRLASRYGLETMDNTARREEVSARIVRETLASYRAEFGSP